MLHVVRHVDRSLSTMHHLEGLSQRAHARYLWTITTYSSSPDISRPISSLPQRPLAAVEATTTVLLKPREKEAKRSHRISNACECTYEVRVREHYTE